MKRLVRRIAARHGVHVGVIPPASDRLTYHLLNVFNTYEVNCVLDVGAHHGEYARMLRQAGFRGRIISWEPVGENFERLRRASRQDPDWRVLRHALGRSAGRATMNVPHNTDAASFLTPSDYGREQLRGKLDPARSEEVEVRRLDEVFASAVAGLDRPRVFLKVDTQGYDLEVFEGAAGCIGSVLGVQTELSVRPIYQGMPNHTEVTDRLRGLGFELSGLFPVIVDRQMRLIEMDCVMVRPPVEGEA